MNAPLIKDERDGLLAFLEHQREAVRYAGYGLQDDQARRTPTASGLSLGGLIKHLLYGERTWIDRIQGKPENDGAFEEYLTSFVLHEDEHLADVLDQYRDNSGRTDAVIATVDDLGRYVPLPDEPWYPDRVRCSVRWILFHLIEETARHAGHADIIRGRWTVG